MTTKKIPYKSLFRQPGWNHRAIDAQLVKDIAQSYRDDGEMFEQIKVTSVVNPDADDGIPIEGHMIVDGEHRFLGLEDLRNSTDPDDIAVFEKIIVNGKIEVNLQEKEREVLKDVSVKSNTHRKQLESWEVYAEVVRRSRAGQDQYEIASALRIQQPRVAELLSFQKLIPEIHDAWKARQLATHDLLQFVTMPEEEQEKALKAFLGAVTAAGGSKREARKELGKKAKEKGKKREYANAGKPTRQKIATFVPLVAARVYSAKSAAESAFWDSIAAAFKVINGEVPFEKLDYAKTYVTQKDAQAAEKLIAEMEAKAAAKAEKAAAKVAKAKTKAKAEKAPKAKKEKAPKAEKEKAPKAEKPVKAKKEKAPKAEKPAKAKKEPKAKKPKVEKAPKPAKAAKPVKAKKASKSKNAPVAQAAE